MSNDNVYWEKFDDIDVGREAAKQAGMSITGENPFLGLRLVGTPKQEAMYRRIYDDLMQKKA